MSGPITAARALTAHRPRAGHDRAPTNSAARPASSSGSSASGRRRRASARPKGQNYLQTFTAEATVVDDTPPSVAILPRRPAGRRRMGGREASPLAYEAADNAGVKAGPCLDRKLRPAKKSHVLATTPSGSPVPMVRGRSPWKPCICRKVTQPMHLTAVDAAGNGAESAPVTVRIDNTAPGAVPVSVEGGEAWRKPRRLRPRLAKPARTRPRPDHRRRLAHLQSWDQGMPDRHRLRPLGRPGRRPHRLRARVNGKLRYGARMAPATLSRKTLSLPVRLRFDPEPPELGFEPTAPQDPTRIAVQVADKVSGVAGGEIELSRVGSGVWQPLPSALDGNELVARIEDATLPAGEYQLRGERHRQRRATRASTEKLAGGAPLRLTLPLRTPTSLAAGVLHRHRVRKAVGKGGHRHVVRHAVTELVPKETVRFGGQRPLRRPSSGSRRQPGSGSPGGGLPTGPRRGRSPGRDPEHRGSRADSSMRRRPTPPSGCASSTRGRRRPCLPKGALSSSSNGASTLKVDPTQVLNGGSVTFSGRVRGRPLPAPGQARRAAGAPLSRMVDLPHDPQRCQGAPGKSPTASSGPAASSTSASAPACRVRPATRSSQAAARSSP